MPSRRRPATSVVVLRWPCGTPMRSRSPHALRPCVRAMFVAVQVSSMNTSLAGSSSGCASNQARRLLTTSARSCSTACPVFFSASGVRQCLSDHWRSIGSPLEEARQGRARRGDAALGQTGAQLLEALVARLLEGGHDVRMPRLDPPRPHVAALRLRREAPRRPPLRVPADHRRHRHAKASRRRPSARSAINSRQRTLPQVHRQWLAHLSAPITASRTESQKPAALGIPRRFETKGTALADVRPARRSRGLRRRPE